MYSTKTVSSQTTSPWIPLDDNQAAFSATVVVEVSGTLTYTVEFTLDNVQDPAVTPVAFPIGLVGETTSNTTFIRSPVKAIRLNVTAFTSGSATIGARQGTDNVWGYPDSTDFADDFATSAKTLWTNGMLFWIPAGDGGATGLAFAGDGSGSFLLSSAFGGLASGSFGFVLLPDNAGGSGNVAGWYYFVFTGAASGKIYTHTYDSTSGLYPTIPDSLVELSFTSSARITTTTAEMQTCQIPINYVTQMGINGMLEAVVFGLGATMYLRAGSNLLYSNDFTGSGMQEVYVNINSVGSMSKQITMRHNYTFGGITSSLNANYKTVNLAAENKFIVGLKLASTAANGIVCLHKLTAIYGE